MYRQSKILVASLLMGFQGCFWVSADNIEARFDLDGDGVARPADCDDDQPGIGSITWYLDADGDGFGDPATAVVQCLPVEDAIEIGGDCDDGDDQIHPDAEERCNGVDDNCDAVADEGVDATTWYQDGDGDGFGDLSAPVVSCVQPPDTVGNSDDCDDSQDQVHPNATEVCNGIDDNCRDGVDLADPSVDPLAHLWYRDADGDAYGDALDTVSSCDDPSAFAGEYTDIAQDCDDGDPNIHPNADDLCEVPGPQVDNNCDGSFNNDPNATVYLTDADGDGFGDASQQVMACEQPANTVPIGPVVDCDDTNACINPAATEICNGGVDDDCDPFNDDQNCDSGGGTGGTGGSGGPGPVCP